MKIAIHNSKNLFWHTDICREQMDNFKKQVLLTNHKMERMISYILLIISIALLCVDAAATAFWSVERHILDIYSWLHVLLLIVPVAYLVVSYIMQNINIQNTTILSVINTFIICNVLMLCALVSAYNNKMDMMTVAYIVALFCIASLILLNNYEIFIIYSVSFFVYITGLVVTDVQLKDRLGSIMFLAILNILAIALTRIRYVSFAKEFMDNIIILKKNNELKQLTALLEATFNNIPDPIILKNTELEILYVNKAAEVFFGRSREEIRGTKCYALRNRNSACDKCVMGKIVNKIESSELVEEYEPISKIWTEQRSYPVIDDSEQVIKIIDHIRDITKQKKTEMELQRINSILRAQLEASLDGIVIVDENNHILSYNKRLITILKIPDSVLRDNDGEKLKKFVMKSIVDEGETNEFTRLSHSDLPDKSYEKIRMRSNRVLEVCSVPVVLPEYEAGGRVWYFRDVTDKEHIIGALKQSAEENERLLKESMQYDMLKSEFFANISHEFRTPINVLLGIIQLLNTMKIDGLCPENTEKTKRYLRIMKQNCYRLLRLTNNLIDMTRLDNGFFEVSLKNCNIVQIIEDITLSVASYIENKGISITFDTDIEEKIMAVDPDKLERIMLNLLSNAVKFTERDGSIYVNMSDKGDRIEISVKDTGIGIPEDKLNVIFERFRQVNNLLTREREGSGIGLSLTKNLVELLGGNIRATSKQGEGSEFIIQLPYRFVEGEVADKEDIYTNQSQVERIHIEFSDIYSIQNSI